MAANKDNLTKCVSSFHYKTTQYQEILQATSSCSSQGNISGQKRTFVHSAVQRGVAPCSALIEVSVSGPRAVHTECGCILLQLPCVVPQRSTLRNKLNFATLCGFFPVPRDQVKDAEQDRLFGGILRAIFRADFSECGNRVNFWPQPGHRLPPDELGFSIENPKLEKIHFSTFWYVGLRLTKEKCEFLKSFSLSEDGIRPIESKVRAIREILSPNNKIELKTFLGIVLLYSVFVSHLADVASPLYELLGEQVEWKWTHRRQAAFEAIKRELKTAPVLSFYDLKRPVVVACDASPFGIGPVLAQLLRELQVQIDDKIHEQLSQEVNSEAYILKPSLLWWRSLLFCVFVTICLFPNFFHLRGYLTLRDFYFHPEDLFRKGSELILSERDSVLSFKKLNEFNYVSWKRDMLACLANPKHVVVPGATADVVTKFDTDQSKAGGIIFLGIEDKLKCLLDGLTGPVERWEKLGKTFEPKSKARISRLLGDWDDKDLFSQLSMGKPYQMNAYSGTFNVEGVGTVEFTHLVNNAQQKIILNNVGYVPTGKRNLISGSRAMEAGCSWSGKKDEILVRNKNEKPILKFTRSKGLFKLVATKCSSNSNTLGPKAINGSQNKVNVTE
uniref:RNA-directed DNA polymerase n=1 Tax=Strigamia maritima TaxID=126957 RepID=T1IHQ4_STRMM